MFIRRSMLVRLNLVRPLFCISLVSGPATKSGAVRPPTRTAHVHSFTRDYTHTQTCEDDEAVAGLRVAKDASSQQHILVGQGVPLVSPVQRPTETIQLVVRGLAHHLTFTHTQNVKIINSAGSFF